MIYKSLEKPFKSSRKKFLKIRIKKGWGAPENKNTCKKFVKKEKKFEEIRRRFDDPRQGPRPESPRNLPPGVFRGVCSPIVMEYARDGELFDQ